VKPRAYWGPYAASKAALEALVMSYAEEVRIMPIKVNVFNPGATATAMRAKAYPGEDPKSLPQPEDVAPAIVDLMRAESERHAERINFRDEHMAKPN
jgi:NAD(P)-dependent dehydrogenase (short-subunit alcohol dehydrogenase family)